MIHILTATGHRTGHTLSSDRVTRNMRQWLFDDIENMWHVPGHGWTHLNPFGKPQEEEPVRAKAGKAPAHSKMGIRTLLEYRWHPDKYLTITPNGRYRVYIRIRSKKIDITRIFARKADAIKWRDERIAELLRGEGANRAEPKTIRDHIEHLWHDHKYITKESKGKPVVYIFIRPYGIRIRRQFRKLEDAIQWRDQKLTEILKDEAFWNNVRDNKQGGDEWKKAS